MCENRFFICNHCGNVMGLLEDSGVPIICCGEPMEHMDPDESDGAKEKHLPVVDVQENRVRVTVGEVEHPMSDDHSIHWVYLSTTHGGHRKCLAIDHPPVCEFLLTDEEPLAVFAYCNLHGLYKTEL